MEPMRVYIETSVFGAYLVNPSRIRAFNGVNAMQGYGPVVILTPADLNRALEENDGQKDKDF